MQEGRHHHLDLKNGSHGVVACFMQPDSPMGNGHLLHTSPGFARALASTLLCPVTVVKTRMEYSGKGAIKYRDTWDALRTIARTEGPRGLFRGLVPTVMTTAPFSGGYESSPMLSS